MLSTLTEGRPPRALRMASSSASAARERSTVRLAWAGAGERAWRVCVCGESFEREEEERGGKRTVEVDEVMSEKNRCRRTTTTISQPTRAKKKKSHSTLPQFELFLSLSGPPFALSAWAQMRCIAMYRVL